MKINGQPVQDPEQHHATVTLDVAFTLFTGPAFDSDPVTTTAPSAVQAMVQRITGFRPDLTTIEAVDTPETGMWLAGLPSAWVDEATHQGQIEISSDDEPGTIWILGEPR